MDEKMKNVMLYCLVVLIWGSTWLAIAFQAGEAPALVSVFYRFLLASVTMLTLTGLTGQLKDIRKKLTPGDMLFCLLQGLCLYSLNYLCFYTAVRYVSSGVESLVFSLAVVFNTLGARFFWKQRIPAGTVPAAAAGIAGLLLILSADLSGSGQTGGKGTGILLCLAGTVLFSLGNMISMRHHRRGLAPVVTNTAAMSAGTGLLGVLLVLTGTPLTRPASAGYLGALLYLAVPGSVVAFSAYLTLVNRIGPQKAAYSTVMTPLIALTLSVLFEGVPVTGPMIAGAVLILSGNLLIQRGGTLIRRQIPPLSRRSGT